MNNIQDEVKVGLESLAKTLKEDFQKIKDLAVKDVQIDEISPDSTLVNLPKLKSKWSVMLSDETIALKDLYTFKENVRFERWKYYNGKQTDQYIAANGVLHEKILKSDIDKYMAADVKLSLLNTVISIQKEKVDFIERTLKDIGDCGFHIRGIIDWRKYVSGN